VDTRIRHAIELMKETPAEGWTPARLAAHVQLSASRFSHLFTAEVGCSPSQYVRTLRFERARALLVDSTLTIRQVMTASGFRDPSHFAKDFRLRFGVAPREFRRRLRYERARQAG
jgi:AraC family transcriptional regulator of arabinose operon